MHKKQLKVKPWEHLFGIQNFQQKKFSYNYLLPIHMKRIKKKKTNNNNNKNEIKSKISLSTASKQELWNEWKRKSWLLKIKNKLFLDQVMLLPISGDINTGVTLNECSIYIYFFKKYKNWFTVLRLLLELVSYVAWSWCGSVPWKQRTLSNKFISSKKGQLGSSIIKRLKEMMRSSWPFVIVWAKNKL